MKRRSALLAWSLLALVPACGGGGGGGGGPALVQGKALAPNGSLAEPVAGTLTPTLSPVVGANVFVFQIDDGGNPVGSPIVSTTTDANGAFSFPQPAGGFASDVVVQITNLGSPSPIPVVSATGTSETPIACPLAGPELTIDPSAELATRLVLSQIATAASTLGNFTVGEVASWVGVIQTQFSSNPLLVGASVEGTIANLEQVLPPELDTVLDGLDEPGFVAAPAGFGGTYGFVEYGLQSQGNLDEDRRISRGTIVVNAVTGAVTFNGQETSLQRNVVCTADCDRTFTTVTETQPFSGTGSVVLAGSGLAMFTFQEDSGGDDGPSVVLGNLSADGTVVLLPFLEESGVGLVVGLKQSALSALLEPVTTLNGDYGFSAILSSIPDDGSSSGSWSGVEASVDRGDLSFLGGTGTFTGNATGDDMAQQITCTGSPCGLTATIDVGSLPQTLGGSFTVGAQGDVTLTGIVDATDVAGQINPSNQAVAFRLLDPANALTGLAIATRRGTGMTAASLSGNFGFATIEEHVQTSSDSEIGGTTGTLTFDGAGNVTIVMTNASVHRQACTGGPACSALVFRSSTSDAGTGTYTVAPNGDVAVTLTVGGGVTIQGTLSADGSILVLHYIDDVATDSTRFLLVATKS